MQNSPPSELAFLQPSAILPAVSRVYALFSALSSLAQQKFAGELGGKLLLYGQLDAEGAAFSLAANIAGAATLGIDPDGERLKRGIRNGYCDFLVNHLDEALRILKNELRKKQPVSVCLEGDLTPTLREAVERGLQPDLLAASLAGGEVDVLVGRGATVLLDARQPTDTPRAEVTWTSAKAPALWLPKIDALAASLLPAQDERRRWLQLAPRYIGRPMATWRYLRMTPDEADRFAALVDAGISFGRIRSEITILR